MRTKNISGLFACLIVFVLAFTVLAEPLAVKSPVLLVGDSMMKLPGGRMERELSKLPDVDVTLFAGIGTGLARLDAFDWLKKMRDLCAEVHPKVAVVVLGANDRQPIQADTGAILKPGTPEWSTEYSTRVGAAMDILINGGCETIIWLLLPPMKDPQVDKFAQYVNETIKEEAAKREQVLPYDFSPLVVDRKTGKYAERVLNPKTATMLRVRDIDGIHLGPDGAAALAKQLMDEFWK